MTVIEKWIGSKKPATLGDLSILQENIHLDLMQMEERLGKKFVTKNEFKGLRDEFKDLGGELGNLKNEFEDLRGQVNGMEKTLETVLKTLKSMESLLKNVATHEPRIRRLEKEVFFAK